MRIFQPYAARAGFNRARQQEASGAYTSILVEQGWKDEHLDFGQL
jgi:hypothetical protein